MKYRTRDGELKIDEFLFLPSLELSEYEIDDKSIKIEEYTSHGDTFTNFIPSGKYKKITANVTVTRYYKINNK